MYAIQRVALAVLPTSESQGFSLRQPACAAVTAGNFSKHPEKECC